MISTQLDFYLRKLILNKQSINLNLILQCTKHGLLSYIVLSNLLQTLISYMQISILVTPTRVLTEERALDCLAQTLSVNAQLITMVPTAIVVSMLLTLCQ